MSARIGFALPQHAKFLKYFHPSSIYILMAVDPKSSDEQRLVAEYHTVLIEKLGRHVVAKHAQADTFLARRRGETRPRRTKCPGRTRVEGGA
jgi:hypothetical protein